jgi:hypothetical protein
MNLINKDCENCCANGNCIKKAFTKRDGEVDWNECCREVTKCRQLSINKEGADKRRFAVKKVKESIVETCGSKFKYVFTVTGLNKVETTICRECFKKLYGLTNYQIFLIYFVTIMVTSADKYRTILCSHALALHYQ